MALGKFAALAVSIGEIVVDRFKGAGAGAGTGVCVGVAADDVPDVCVKTAAGVGADVCGAATGGGGGAALSVIGSGAELGAGAEGALIPKLGKDDELLDSEVGSNTFPAAYAAPGNWVTTTRLIIRKRCRCIGLCLLAGYLLSRFSESG